jgi:hypothetical protein
MDTKTRNLLNQSFDRDLTPLENELLQKAMLNDAELRNEAATLQKLRDILGTENFSFSPFFTEKVMSSLEVQEGKMLEYAFLRIALPGLIAASVLLLISFFGGNTFSLDTIMGVETLQPEYLTDFLFFGN